MKTFNQFQEARLSAAERRALPDKDFALPGKGEGPKGKQAGSYPIPDEKHARAALSMVAQHGTPEEKAKVRAKVKAKFPDIGEEVQIVGEEKRPFPDEKVSKKLSSLDKKMASKPYGYKRSNEKNRSMKIDMIRDAVKRGEDPRKDTQGGAFAKRGNPDHDHRANFSDNRRKRTVKPAGVKKVEEEVGISSSAAMKKAQKEAELRKKEQEAVKKAKKVSEAKVDTGKSADEKATARNLRNTPPGADKTTDLKTFITRKPGESLDKARQRVRQGQHAARRGVSEGLGVALGAVGGGIARAAGGIAGGVVSGAGSVAAGAQEAAAKNRAAATKNKARQQVADKQAQDIKREGGVTEGVVDIVKGVRKNFGAEGEAKKKHKEKFGGVVESATHPQKFSMRKFAQGLEKKHGKGTVLSKYTSKPKPPTEAEKREYAAHKAKIAGEDRRDDLEKATDGRYSRKYSNRGSD